jgi:protein TonB
MFKKCLLASIVLHILFIIGAGLNSPHPSFQVKPVYFQLINAEMSEKHGAGGPGILSRRVLNFPKKTKEVQPNQIQQIAETTDSNYDTVSNQPQAPEIKNVTGDTTSISIGTQDNSGINSGTENQPGEGTNTDGNAFGGAGNLENKSNIKQAKITKDVMPTYPREAREKGWEGVVKLEAVIGKDGRVGKITVVQSSGYRLLDDEAIKAVKKRRYQPAAQDGKPIESIRQIPIRFKLEDS